jgi:hypothetical protein
MKLRSAQRTRGILVAIVLAGLVAWAPATADEEQELSLHERLDKNLLGMQNNLTNASAKLRRGVAGVSSAGAAAAAAAGRPPTPAEACCGSNLERLDEKIHAMTQTLEQLDVYYAERNQSDGLAGLYRIRGELNTVARGVVMFKMAEASPRTVQALQGIVQPFNRLRAAIEDLKACCPLEGGTSDEGEKQP